MPTGKRLEGKPMTKNTSTRDRRAAKYDHSVEAHMVTSFIQLPEHLEVRKAIAEWRHVFAESQDTSYVFLHDAEGKLSGVASLRELLLCGDETLLKDLSKAVTYFATPGDSAEESSRLLIEKDLRGLPVVRNGVLIGVLTADDAGEIIQEETYEDFERLASTTPRTSRDTPLKKASIWMAYRSRVAWLVLLVFGNIFSGAGIAHFEDLIASSVALVFFLPLLIDSGGNAGSQSATLMIRSMATGSVKMRDWSKLIAREVIVAAMIGFTMAATVSIIGIIRGGPEVAFVVALSMIVIVMLGSLIGMSLPFVLARLGLDPANASAPLITSICDGVGVIVYFSIASQVLL